MISSLKFSAPHYAAGLEALAGKTLTFRREPGVTILFGPSGCGKSTVLRGMGKGSHASAGWSSPPEPAPDLDPQERPRDFEAEVRATGIEVDWDGTPTLLYDGTSSLAIPLGLEDDVDGLSGSRAFKDNVMKIALKPSPGQWKRDRLNRLFNSLEQVPDLTVPAWQNYNTSRAAAGREFADYASKKERTGVAAILLDEPGCSLSVPDLAQMYTKVLPYMATKFRAQVVVATHDLYALVAPGADVVDLAPGYAGECRRIAREVLKPLLEDI